MTFLAMAFMAETFQAPLISLIPLVIVVRTSCPRNSLLVLQLVAYAAGIRLPYGIPGGLSAVSVGTALAWTFKASHFDHRVSKSG